MSAEPYTPPDQVKAFLHNQLIRTLRDHDTGHTADKLGKAFAEVVEAVKKHQKVGKLKITLAVETDEEPGPDGNLAAAVTIDYKVEAPRAGVPKRTMFTNSDGGMSLDHPGQMRIDGV